MCIDYVLLIVYVIFFHKQIDKFDVFILYSTYDNNTVGYGNWSIRNGCHLDD